MEKKELLRSLPKIDELLKEELIINEMEHSMRNVVIDSLRDTIEYYRKGILNGDIKEFTKEDILSSFTLKIKKSNSLHLKRVINATGVIIHTNLGRSVLCKEAAKNVLNVAENYNNLEYNLEEGRRGSRYSHVEDLIIRITGAEAAMVVNNNAAAVLLAMDTLCRGKEAIVSRGQLVEIGGSFRIPDVMKFSGAELIEVGTTNRTHLYDFENAVTDKTGILLKVHTSNYKILGFTEEVPLEDIAELGRKHGIPVVEDIGSGTLIDFGKYGLSPEPTVQNSIKNGADVVTFSGDKMLGGPQAGIIVGKKIYIDMMKKNQLTRALRIDKMTLAALEGTLKYYLDEKAAVENIPTMNMLLASSEVQKKRAYRLKRKLQNKASKFNFTVDEDYSVVGGGSMPAEKVKTYAVKAKSSSRQPEQIEKMLRGNDIPIIVRVSNDEVILDVRTIFDKDFDVITDAFETINMNM
jgi:L-seryl-tRNA(Ser) seleniumtransferase